jgi:hypothetical protein
MQSNEHIGEQITKGNPNGNSKPMVTDFGLKAISTQNFSKVVALPKTALANCGEPTHVEVKLVQENGIKYLKLIPIVQKGGEKVE